MTSTTSARSSGWMSSSKRSRERSSSPLPKPKSSSKRGPNQDLLAGMSSSQTPSRVPRMVRARRFSVESSAASVCRRRVVSTSAPVMRLTWPWRPRTTVAVSAIQRCVPSGEHHAVFAEIGGIFQGGFKGRALNALEIVGVYRGEVAVEIVERGAGGNAEDLVEIVGGDPALVAEVQVHGGDAGDGLRHVERVGGVAQRLFELLALGDVGDGADDARGVVFGVAQQLAAAGEPAHAAVGEQ